MSALPTTATAKADIYRPLQFPLYTPKVDFPVVYALPAVAVDGRNVIEADGELLAVGKIVKNSRLNIAFTLPQVVEAGIKSAISML